MDPLEYAQSLGFPVELTDRAVLDPAAARMLSVDSFAVPVGIGGDVLEVLTDHVPTPAQFAALERASGCTVTVTVTSPEVLTRTRDRLRSLLASADTRPLRDLWARVRHQQAFGVTVVAGQVPVLDTAAGPARLADEHPVSVQELQRWIAQTCGQLTANVVPDGADLWRVRQSTASGQAVLNMRLLSSRIPRADELGMPSLSASVAALRAGLVLVTGPPCSGRSTAALALAEWAQSITPRQGAVIGQPVERPLSARVSSSWALTPGMDAADAHACTAAAVHAGAGLLVIDTASDPTALAGAVTAAASGALVFAVVDHRDSIVATQALLSLVGPGMAAQVLAAAVSSRLLPGVGGVVPVFEMILACPQVTAAVAGGGMRLASAAEAAGAAAAIGLDRALAAAVSSGQVTRETARSACVDPARFDVVAGGVEVLGRDAGLDVDADLLDLHPQ